jgi:histidinol-phosphate aminotransferase
LFLNVLKSEIMSSRRNWLKQTSLGIVGLGIVPLENFAITKTENISSEEPNLAPIYLRSNENPYGPSVLARDAMTKGINSSNRYNWDLASELISEIAKKHDLLAENITLGAGSTVILDLVVRYCARSSGSFILADPSYNYWTDAAEEMGVRKISVPLTEEKKLDLFAMLKAIQPDTKLVYICNPNNPTGTICERDALVSFINEATKKAVVLVDEAYIEFSNEKTLVDLVKANKNLIIAKTFSKIYGLAGARVGYGIANSDTIEKISRIQSWNNGGVSSGSVSAALASIKDERFVSETHLRNEEVRKYTVEELEKLKIKCIASHSNFVYFSLSNYNKDFFEQLERNNIVGTKIYEKNGKWSRITIGTRAEMERFINALK